MIDDKVFNTREWMNIYEKNSIPTADGKYRIMARALYHFDAEIAKLEVWLCRVEWGIIPSSEFQFWKREALLHEKFVQSDQPGIFAPDAANAVDTFRRDIAHYLPKEEQPEPTE